MHDPGRLLCPCCQAGTADHHHDSDGALGDIEQLSLKIGEAEGGDYKVGENAETADDEGGGELKHNVAPDNGVCNSLKHLVTFVGLVLDASLIGTDTFDHQSLLVLGKALRSDGRIGQPPADKDSPNASDQAEDEEQQLPWEDDAMGVV